jgi:hypothetical protein
MRRPGAVRSLAQPGRVRLLKLTRHRLRASRLPGVLASALSFVLALGPGSGPGGSFGNRMEVGAPEDGVRFDPPALEPGYDLYESWNDVWRRFQDRNGRPDPRGPLLQPSPELQNPEYELTLAVAQHPLYLERDWNRRTRGARVFIHSDDEFSFFNRVQAKERIPMGRVGALGLRYDRLELREIHSSMFQLAFAFPDIRGTGAFVEIRPVARFEKPDLDIEVAFGWARPERGRVQMRVFSFDPFNNATDALAVNRSTPQELRVVARAPSFGLAAEGELLALRSVRASLYLGGVIPARQSYYYADSERFNHEREQSALLGGGWLEWAVPRSPVLLGASAVVVETRQKDHNFEGAILDWVREHETRARVYALARLDKQVIDKFLGSMTIELAGNYRLTELPQHTSTWGAIPRDRSWMGFVRANWMPTRVFGLELGYFVLDRLAAGDNELAGFLTGTNHRLSTRFSLAFAPHVWITFGVGWDLDDPDRPYDQGGMTLTGRW